jgi:hypothetical protein
MLTPAAQARTGIREVGPIWERLPEITRYMAQPSVWMVLLGMALLWWFLRFVPMLGGLMIAGIEAAVFFHVLETSAFGADELDPPDITDLFEDVALPLLRYIAATLPITVAIVWAGLSVFEGLARLRAGASPSALFGGMTEPLVLLAIGVLLAPLLFAVGAIGRSVISMFNPAIWVSSIKTMGAEYVVGSLLFYGAVAVGVLVFGPLAGWIYVHVPIPFVGPIVATALASAPLILQARVLGIMCEPFMERGPAGAAAPQPNLPAARVVAAERDAPPNASSRPSRDS